jgi:hypothetical protein
MHRDQVMDAGRSVFGTPGEEFGIAFAAIVEILTSGEAVRRMPPPVQKQHVGSTKAGKNIS